MAEEGGEGDGGGGEEVGGCNGDELIEDEDPATGEELGTEKDGGESQSKISDLMRREDLAEGGGEVKGREDSGV